MLGSASPFGEAFFNDTDNCTLLSLFTLEKNFLAAILSFRFCLLKVIALQRNGSVSKIINTKGTKT